MPVDLFFFCAMVEHVMARVHNTSFFMNVTAFAVPARQLVSPGTLVFLGRAR
jgi:hypothetical protein